MPSKSYLTSPPEITTMPKGIPYIVGNEAAERFSYYGMKGILAIFMTQHLLDAAGQPDFMSDEEATAVISNFNMAVYALPIIGAILADWLIGKYRMILYLSLVYCLGHLVLALMDFHSGLDQRTLLFLGMGLIALGSGGIKPCVSAHVGDQFSKSNEHLMSKVYGWFYFSINFGAMFSTLSLPLVAKYWGYSWAFGIPAALMFVATLCFWMGRNRFVHVPPTGRQFFKRTFTPDGIRSLVQMIPFILILAPFWCLYDQTHSRWVLQAVHMDRHILTLPFWAEPYHVIATPDQLLAVNAILVMVLIPVFNYIIYPFMNRFFEVTLLRKIGIGLFITVVSYLVPTWIQTQIDAGLAPSVWWQIFAYFLITCAEVLVSISGLEFSYKYAPNSIKSIVMGVFLFSTSLGNFITSAVNNAISHFDKLGTPILQGANYYWCLNGMMLASAIVFVIWAPNFKGKVHIQSENDLDNE